MNENGPYAFARDTLAWLFDARCDGGANNFEIRVHEDFTEAEAASAAQKYGNAVGRLPKVLRSGIGTAPGIRILSIHKGRHNWTVSRLFGNICVYTEFAQDRHDEEIMVHEAVHVSLDAKVISDPKWVAAQKADGAFISYHAKNNPQQEDVADSFVAYLAARFRPLKIKEAWKTHIFQTIPNRIAYFDALLSADDMKPFTSASLPRTARGEVPEDNPVSLSVSGNGAIAEGDAALTITATLETANATGAALAIPVQVRADGTTATAGDYTLAETISIPDGASSGTTAFAVVDDSEDEPGETVVVELGSPLPSGIAAGATDHVTIAIADNDEPPAAVTVALAAERTSVAEDNGEVKFTVTLGRALEAGETAVVPLTVTGGKPNHHWNIRFRPKDNGPGVKRTATGRDSAVTFTEGGRVATLVLIASPNRDTVERTIRIAFGTGERAPVATGVAGGIAPAGDALSVAIVDDDAAVGLAFRVKDERAREDAGAMRFTVRLTKPAAEVVQVRARTRDARPVSARANRDYKPVRVDLSFRPGETEKHVRVRIFNDAHDEGRETFELVLSNAEGAVIADRVAVGTIENDDLPEIVIAAGSGVTEGDDASFTLTATPPPAAPLEVTVMVATEGAFGITAGQRTVTIPTTGAYTLTLATDNDGTDEANGSVTATVDAGSGYTVGAASSGTVAIADDDLPPPAVSVTAGSGVIEGGDAVFTVTADRAPDANLSVALTVSEAAGSDFVAAADEGAKTVTILAGKTSATLTVRTEDDRADEPDGSVTATLATGDGYTVGSASSGTVAVADNDAAGALPVLTVESRSVQEGNGKVIVWATIDPFPSKAAFPELHRTTRLKLRTIEGTAWDGVDYVGIPAYFGITEACNFHTTLAPSGKHGCRIDEVTVLDDSHDDGGETFQIEVGFADSEPAPLRGLGADASAPASPASAADPFGAGLSDNRFGTPSLQSRGMTARDVLLGSSFSLTGQNDGAGGSLAFWGRASQASFDGAERGDGTDIRLDGTVTTGMLGADYARGKWLVGLALTQSSSEGSYAAIGGGDPCPDTDGDLCDGAVRAGDGDVEASLTAAIPYAALQVSERLKLWGAAGYGTGEVTLKTMEENYKADTSWTMAAAGVRGDLLEAPKEGSGPALALTSDALWARTSSDKTRDLAATDSDATRLRLGLEGSYRVALDGDGHPGSGSGASLTPKLEIGARHDGGDAETGFGVEVGGGIAWVDPGLGLSLDVSGRTLLAHENDDLKDRGMSASLAFDPAPATRRGPSFSLRQDFGGQANGGLDALFAPAPLEDRTGREATSRWAMEAAYGFPAFGGRFTGSPHVGLGLATGSRDYSVGWRLAPEAATAPDLSFGLKATRRESDTQAAEHTVGFEITARW